MKMLLAFLILSFPLWKQLAGMNYLERTAPLNWDDTKGPNRNSKLAAETYCSINTEVSYSAEKLSVASKPRKEINERLLLATV